MVGKLANSNDAQKGMGDHRAQWSTPRVIVSDLGNARADTIIPGGDGVDPIFPSYAYGS